jgi:hypothetical protein
MLVCIVCMKTCYVCLLRIPVLAVWLQGNACMCISVSVCVFIHKAHAHSDCCGAMHACACCVCDMIKAHAQ